MNKAVLLLAVYGAFLTGSVLGYGIKAYFVWKTTPIPVAVEADRSYINSN